MRGLFEGSEVLTRILVTESESKTSQGGRKTSGIRVVVSDNFQYLIRIEDALHGHNLTPWLRRKESLLVQVPTHLKAKKVRQLSSAEFAGLAATARTGKNQAAVAVHVHALTPGHAVHVAVPGRFSAHRVYTDAELKSLLKRAERQFGRLEVTVVSATLKTLHLVYALLPSHSLTFERERGSQLAAPGRAPLRSVLVLTNVAGMDLGHLEQNLPFWSKGISGFRFRHVFGQLTAKRVEASLLGREWDLVVYRGHGKATESGLQWKLVDGEWLVPPAIAPVYVHSSCLANSELLPLDSLPAAHFITPLTYLTDFDDSRLVRLFLERYKASRNIQSAIRAAQAEFGQFVLINSAP